MKVEVWSQGETTTLDLQSFLDRLNIGLDEGTLVRCEGMQEFTTPDVIRHHLVDHNIASYHYENGKTPAESGYRLVRVAPKE